MFLEKHELDPASLTAIESGRHPASGDPATGDPANGDPASLAARLAVSLDQLAAAAIRVFPKTKKIQTKSDRTKCFQS